MALSLWILLVTAASIGAALAAVTAVPARRVAGLLTATAAVTALLALLGMDLPAVVWLGLGGAASLLSLPAGGEPAPAPASDRGALLGAGVAAGLLFAILYRVAVQADWRSTPVEPVAGQSAIVGGLLLTADLALLVAATMLITVALVVTARRRGRDAAPGSTP